MAEPRVAHERRRRRTGRGHMAGGRACPGVHADARVGATWQERVDIWRAHGLVGPGKNFGAITQMHYRAPIFILTILIYLFRVGLCPTYVLPFAGDVGARRASDLVRTAEIAWTRIIKSGTCAKYNLSDGDRKAYLTPRGDTRNMYLHQREDRTIVI